MVQLVNRLVDRTIMQTAVEPVMPSILQNKADGYLESNLPYRGERNAVVHAKVGGDGMEEPDLRQFGGKVGNENEGSAIPLLLEGRHLRGLDLVLVEIGDLVGNHEGNAAAEVDKLVHDKAHDSGREGIVLHPHVPSLKMC